MVSDKDKSALRSCPIFQGLNEEVFYRLLGSATIREFRLDETIFLQGEKAHSIYVVINGWVKIFRLTHAGDEAVVAVFTRGDSFAEAAAFLNGDYPASGTAVTDCRLLKISSNGLKELIARNPEIALAMLGSSSQRIHMLVQQIEQLKAHTGAQRLAAFLLTLTDKKEGRCVLELPYEKGLIAARLGMKPESLSRAFQKLRGYGVLSKKEVAVVDDLAVLIEMTQQERATVMNRRL